MRAPGHMEYFFLAAQKASRRHDDPRRGATASRPTESSPIQLDRQPARRRRRYRRRIWWCWPSAWCRTRPTASSIRELIDSRHQAEHSESSQVREKSAARAEELKSHEGTEILHLDVPPGPRSADPQVRLPGLALHLLPLRIPSHRHLCRRHCPRADGLGRRPPRTVSARR